MTAIARGISYFEREFATQPHLAAILDALHRRFGLSQFGDMLARYDEMTAKAPEQARPSLKVLRRILDASNPISPADLNAIAQMKLDGITGRALYCDRIALPPDYAERLQQAADDEQFTLTGIENAGDYGLTHVALALLWIRENGCRSPVTPEFETSVIQRMGALLRADDGIVDVEVEAGALLFALGHGELVAERFLDAVVAAQLESGAWPYDSRHPDRAHWHTSSFALWLLLESERGAKATMLAR